MQISMFDGVKPFKINKPIRLIELFGGYGSQSLALKYLGIPFEHYKLSEWAIKSIQAYKDLHFSSDNTDYSGNMTIAEVKSWLSGRISSDYSTPLNDKQIERLSEKEARKIYNNMKATNNLGSIMAINGKDLEITDTDKYCYIMTYSFPCQDLSSAGKGKGMGRDSGTRSGLLWEVERMLKELSGYIPHRVKPNGKIFSATEWVDTYELADTTKLPQVLLMENVPEVIGAKNIKHFAEWQAFLEKLGYKNKWECLIAKDFGIAQNRNRCFMVSILGDYYYDMPTGFKLEHVLKYFLDKKVDESYYLKDETIRSLNLYKERHESQGHGFGWKPSNGGSIAHTIKTEGGYRPDSNFIIEQSGKADRESWNGSYEHDNGERLQRVWQSSDECGNGSTPPPTK